MISFPVAELGKRYPDLLTWSEETIKHLLLIDVPTVLVRRLITNMYDEVRKNHKHALLTDIVLPIHADLLQLMARVPPLSEAIMQPQVEGLQDTTFIEVELRAKEIEPRVTIYDKSMYDVQLLLRTHT